MANSDDANEVINKVRHRFESHEAATAWFEAEPLSGFSGLTAAELVEAGRTQEVLTYFEAVDAGVHS